MSSRDDANALKSRKNCAKRHHARWLVDSAPVRIISDSGCPDQSTFESQEAVLTAPASPPQQLVISVLRLSQVCEEL